MSDKPVDGDDDDFGAMFEASLGRKHRRLKVGDRVKGTVSQVGQARLILDLGDGQDGLMEFDQLGKPGERPEVKEGDVLEAFVLGFENRVPELGLKAGRGVGGRVSLEEAHRSRLPVQGTVSEVNKGGYVVDVAGTRCFCPMGAMDTRRIDDPATMLGRRLSFRVTEMKSERDVVLSRRAVLVEENAQRAAETRERLVVGARFRGTVTNVRDFGAFVDLGGVEGLVPAGELGFGWTRPQDAVSVDQVVDVEVLRIEAGPDGRERIALSMKALKDDPFDAAAQALAPGAIVAGAVTRIQPFGAFVELVPGVEGLLHVSAFGKRVAHPSEMVKAGQVVAVRVDGIDLDARRISLHFVDQTELENAPAEAGAGAPSLRILRHEAPAPVEPVAPTPAAGADRADRADTPPRPAPVQARLGDVLEVTVDKVETFGVFVSWPAGRGLVPGRELGVPRNADLRRQFPVGMKFKAAVVDVRDDGKIALSRTAVERVEERADTEAYMNQPGSTQGRGFGTLGDLLKGRRP